MTMTADEPHEHAADLLGRPVTARQLVSLPATPVERAERPCPDEVAYRTLDTPIGTMLLASTATGLVRVAFEREGLDEVLGALADKVSPRVLRAPRRLDAAARQLEEYFARRRSRFELALGLRLSGGFRRSVLAYLPRIGYGTTASYQQVAAAVDNPRAMRAVGSACATNPLPIVIPCHRVVRSGGQLGAYLGGADVKLQLIDLEAGR